MTPLQEAKIKGVAIGAVVAFAIGVALIDTREPIILCGGGGGGGGGVSVVNRTGGTAGWCIGLPDEHGNRSAQPQPCWNGTLPEPPK